MEAAMKKNGMRIAAAVCAAVLVMTQLSSCAGGGVENETDIGESIEINDEMTSETLGETTADSSDGGETYTNSVSCFMDCIGEIPIVGELSADVWGTDEVGARDPDNGLEDDDMSDYSYWDGGIIKNEETGTYYLFASRWDQSLGFDGWYQSKAVYATSDSLYGPYVDRGLLWEDENEGVGHNVFPFAISSSDPLYSEGYRYAIITSDVGTYSESMNGVLHISKSLDGEWERLCKMTTSGGDGFSLSNISIVVRGDGTYEAINRDGDIATASSLSDTWEVYANCIWGDIDGLPLNTSYIEDPVIWYSDGIYHVVANRWDTKEAYYMTSENGLDGWVRHSGYAYTPSETFIKYEDGTENHWSIMERPNVYLENGKVVAMTFAVINTEKSEDVSNDQNGSKLIVVPFDGNLLSEFDAVDVYVNANAQRDGITPIADSAIQSWDSEFSKNYGGDKYLQVQKNSSQGLFGEGVRTDSWYDCKITFLKFDLSKYDISEVGAINSAELSIIYLCEASGNAKNEQLCAAIADSDWTEGTGVESGKDANGNYASAGDLTWENQPTIYYDAGDAGSYVAYSERFDTSNENSEVIIDVTDLLIRYLEENPGETVVTFAICETAGSRVQIGSREAGDSYAPKLSISIGE